MSGNVSDEFDAHYCISNCSDLGYLYAGLHTIKARYVDSHCHCDNIFGRYGLAPKGERCDKGDAMDVFMTRKIVAVRFAC